jgi:hypothetical protein
MPTYKPYPTSRPDDSAETIAAGEANQAALDASFEAARLADAGRYPDAARQAGLANRAASRAERAWRQAERTGSKQAARAEAHAARARAAAERADLYASRISYG